MATFKHRKSGQTVTAEPGTKRYTIFDRSHSWTKVEGKAAAKAEPEGLAGQTVAQLQETAEGLGMTGYKSLNKSDLIAAIEAKQAEG